MGRRSGLCVLLAAVAVAAAGCGGELTTREKGALGGAGLGAATGAIIGSAVGHPGAGAAIGAGVGALGGTMVGGAIQESEQRAEGQQRTSLPAPPPPPAPQQARMVPSGDPTRGQVENATRWRVQLYIDQSPDGLDQAPFVTLNPHDVLPQSLDIGAHRIIARAYVETQFGARPVGRYDRTIQVDPRGAGWSLRFTDGDFK